jgi:hypothetical protein
MLKATKREMEKAHRHHRDHCQDGSCSHLRLLLTYSVECGLKVLLMNDRRVETYLPLHPSGIIRIRRRSYAEIEGKERKPRIHARSKITKS